MVTIPTHSVRVPEEDKDFGRQLAYRTPNGALYWIPGEPKATVHINSGGKSITSDIEKLEKLTHQIDKLIVELNKLMSKLDKPK